MEKTLQQIKDDWAKDYGYIDYKEFYELTRAVDTYQVFIMDGAVNQIAIRYAQEQTKKLQYWKDSEMKVQSELNLQGIGAELGLKLGSSIAPQVFPKILELKDNIAELTDMLNQSRAMVGKLKRLMLVHPDCELGSEFCDYTTDAQNLEDEIEELITKHKQS